MKTSSIKEIAQYGRALIGTEVTVRGWVRAFRSNRFIQINDGSCQGNLQAVIDFTAFPEELIRQISTAAAISIEGVLVESIGSGQAVELEVKALNVIGAAPADEVQKTVMQPKRHSLEFLREQAHFRFRTNTFGAVFRIRHAVSYAIHNCFLLFY